MSLKWKTLVEWLNYISTCSSSSEVAPLHIPSLGYSFKLVVLAVVYLNIGGHLIKYPVPFWIQWNSVFDMFLAYYSTKREIRGRRRIHLNLNFNGTAVDADNAICLAYLVPSPPTNWINDDEEAWVLILCTGETERTMELEWMNKCRGWRQQFQWDFTGIVSAVSDTLCMYQLLYKAITWGSSHRRIWRRRRGRDRLAHYWNPCSFSDLFNYMYITLSLGT